VLKLCDCAFGDGSVVKYAIGIAAGLALFLGGFACGIAYQTFKGIGIAGDPVAQAAARQKAGLPPLQSGPNK
jgi:hypothetical protein